MAKILICEPYAALRDLLEQIVTEMGHQASLYDPKDQHTSDQRADLLILDPADPDAHKWARQQRLNNPDLPILCVSRQSLKQHADDLAPTTYLVKPVTVSELEAAIAATLAAHHDEPIA